ncbi:hypothetical protein GGD62_008002 [Bradyrhizobium sp. ERR14]|nr:hypothetical protein [Bradyrhizobium sp. ERR14]
MFFVVRVYAIGFWRPVLEWQLIHGNRTP